MPVTQFRSYSSSPRHGGGWSNQDLAEFYRIADIMAQAGLAVEADSGVSDEDEPWFVFVRAEAGDVIAHFARIDGLFVAVSALTQEIFRGPDVRHVVYQMLKRHPLMIPQRPNGSRLLLHPSVVLTAFVAAAFVIASDDAHAHTLDDVLQSTFGGKAAGLVDELAGTQQGATDSGEILAPALISDVEVSARKLAVVNSGSQDVGRFTGNQLALISSLILACDLASREMAVAGDAHGGREVLVEGPSTVTLSAYPTPVLIADNNGLTDGAEFDRTDDAGLGEPTVKTPIIAYQSDSEAGDENTGSVVSTLENALKGEQVIAISSGEPSREDVGMFGVSQDVLIGGEVHDQLILRQPMDAPVTAGQSATSSAASSGGSTSSFVDLAGLVRALQNNADPSLEAFITDFEMSHDVYGVVLSQELEALLGNGDTSAVAVRVTNAGIPIEASKSVDDASTQEKAEAKGIEALAQIEAPSKNLTVSGEENSPNADSTPAESPSAVPLVNGHLLRQGDARSLVLTEAVDVLLYEGGNVDVHNFDLGKDRLWFYLDADKVAAANYHFEAEGDLVMKFGSGDVLTIHDVFLANDAAYTFV